MKKKIINFWKCSIDGNMRKFDFEGFFSEFEVKLGNKLKGHGQLSFDDYIKYISKYLPVKLLKKFEYKSEHTGYKEMYKDILLAVFGRRYKMFNKKFKKSKIYQEMANVYGELCNRDSLTDTGKVYLADKCIHLQHISGFVINVDVTKLKKGGENV